MRIALAVGIPFAWAIAAAQVAEKPIQIECQCTTEDISAAGLACSEEEPCPLYLELAAVEAVGNKIFIAGNIHTDDATLYSIVLASEDSGKTWREPHERLKASGLDHIQFVDFENGWISGQMLQPLPQDPFFLVTSDGGKSWRQRPIFGESKVGSVLQFWFSSRTSGSLIIDRGETGQYALYETPNSGDTWMLREVSEKPLRLKRAAGSNPDWRIRADKASQSFRIERRQGEKWTVLAAFAVSAGACKPAPPVPPAPETEAAPPEQPEPRPAPSLKRPPK